MNEGPDGLRRVGVRLRDRRVVVVGGAQGVHRAVAALSMKARGLAGTQLVISDAHAGLKAAIAAVLLGAAWQWCRVHSLRNELARVPRSNSEMVAAAIRTVLAQPDCRTRAHPARRDRRHVRRPFSQAETMLCDAQGDLLAFTAFPLSHWKKSGRPTRWNG